MNEDKIYSFLGLIQKAGKLASGYNSCIFEIGKDKCKLIIVAQDATDNTKDKLISLCNSKKVPVKIWGDKQKLGLSIGKLSRSVLAVKDENMSKVVLNMFE